MPRKEERQKAGAKRTRGHFLSVYKIVPAEELIAMYNDGKLNDQTSMLVQVIDENAACSNFREAQQEAESRGLLGVLVALRRCGNVFERVEQLVTTCVTPKNVTGFNEVSTEEDD